MSNVQMRFRTDGWHWADLRNHQSDESIARIYKDDPEALAQIRATEPAKPGDVWRIHWRKEDASGNVIEPGPLAGYAICCPKCNHVHAWTTAGNCSAARRHYTWKDAQGVEHPASVCIHSGEGSCWQWTGSAEENKLTAHPSLLVTDPDCGFHGWLQNGVLRDC